MTQANSNVVRAAGFLLLSEGTREFLLMRHADRWDLPKGHSDPGESFLETALRETEEETGIGRESIRVDTEFHFELEYPVTYRRRGGQTLQKRVRYFLGYVQGTPEPLLTEHQSSQWFVWSPPHAIQSETIDPLLAAVADYFHH